MQTGSKKKNNKKKANRTRSEKLYYFIVKWPKRILIALVLLFLLLAFIIQLPATQNYIKDKTISKLEKDLETHISISGFKFSITNGFLLKDLYVEDQQQDTLLYASKLKVTLDKGILSLLNNQLFIQDITLQNAYIDIKKAENSTSTNAQFILDYFKKEKSPKNKRKLSLALQSIVLDDVRVHNQDDVKKVNFNAYVGKGLIKVDSINLNTNSFYIKSVKIDNPSFALFKQPITQVLATKPDSTQAKKPITFKIHDINISNGRFASDDFRRSLTRNTVDGVDFAHLDVTKINVDLTRFVFKDRQFSGNLNQLSLQEQSGFNLQKLQAKEFVVSDHLTELKGFLLQTPNRKATKGTKLTNYLSMKYQSYRDFKQFKDKVFIKLNLKDSQVAIQDVLFFAKKLKQKKFIHQYQNHVIDVSGKFFGNINNPRAKNLNISLGNISMIGKVRLSDLNDKEHLSINLDVDRLHTSIPNLKLLLPNIKLPNNINTLGDLVFKGSFSGFLNQFVAYGMLHTDIGDIDADMNLNISNGPDNATYSGKIVFKDFDLSQWFHNDKLGPISVSTSVADGGGIRLNTAHAILNAQVNNFVFKGYEYKDIVLKGKLEKNFFDGALKSNDPNVNFNFLGTIDFTDSIAKYKFSSKVQALDLYKLHLSQKPLKMAGNLDLDLKGKIIKELTGDLKITNLVMHNSDETFKLDSAFITAKLDDPKHQFIQIKSSILDAKLQGVFDLPSLPRAIKSTIISKSPAFAKKLHLTKSEKEEKTQIFDFNLQINHSQNLTKLLNTKIDSFEKVRLSGNFNNQNGYLSIDGEVGKTHIGSKVIGSSIIEIAGKDNQIKARVNIFEIWLNSRKKLPPIAITLGLYPDTLAFQIKASNFNNVLKNLRFNGIVLPMDDYYQMQFNPSRIQVAQDLWKIESDNYFRFSKNFLEAYNISFVSEDRSLELTTPTQNSLNLDLKNFDLSFINSLYNYKNLQYTGPFQANIKWSDVHGKKDIALVMTADTFHINEHAYGKFSLLANLPDFQSPLGVNLNIGENGLLTTKGYIHFFKSPARWKGSYVPPKSINLQGGLNEFPFYIMEDIIPSGISDVHGKFGGYINIKGPLTGPEFDGLATIKNGELTIDYTNAHYYINNQNIRITTTRFDATGGMIEDKYGNQALITGGLNHLRFNHFSINTIINSSKFLVLDTKKGDNPLFYGKVMANALAKFSGDFNQPHLYVNGQSLKDTDLKLLFTEEEEIQANQFINFVSFKQEEKSHDEEQTNVAKGLDIDMYMSVTDDAAIQLIFDETSGDIIQSRGEGDFHLFASRSGEFTLTGQYAIKSGEYLFTLLNFINKPFVIEPGGTITWSGDPMKAIIDLQAVYSGLSAPVYNLIKDELNTLGQNTDITAARVATPIELGLILTGPMLLPNIEFTLDIKNLIGNNKNFVASKLNILKNDPNELNRQVFGLLVLGNFLPPGNSLGIQESGATGLASTLSELLSSQFALYLNSMLSDIIGTSKFYSGTEVDVGLNIYQTVVNVDDNFQQQAFNFNLKNHFFNNRITVQVGGNFELNKNPFSQSQNTSDFSGDILLEIELSKNRRYKVQVYKRLEPDYSGNMRHKSGVGLSYKREFNSLEDLFEGIRKNISKE